MVGVIVNRGVGVGGVSVGVIVNRGVGVGGGVRVVSCYCYRFVCWLLLLRIDVVAANCFTNCKKKKNKGTE